MWLLSDLCLMFLCLNDTATPVIYTYCPPLSLHYALPIFAQQHPGDRVAIGVAFDARGLALHNLQIVIAAEQRLDGGAIEPAVGLRAGALHRRTLEPVEQAIMATGRGGGAAHDHVQRNGRAHQLHLAQPADGRVASHPAGPASSLRDGSEEHTRDTQTR